MSNIRTYLAQILSARYGKDVRQAIHDSINEVDSVARTAKDSAASASQTAIAQASQAVSASQIAVQKADESLAASEQAKMYAENASAVTGIEIAKVDRAGIIKGGDNHIAEDGTLTLTKQTTGKTLDNSCGGGIKVNEIGGKSEQVTTTGKNLFQLECSTKNTNGISIVDNGNQSFSASGTATQDTSFGLSNIENIKDLFLNGFTGILSLTNAVYDQNKCNMSIGYKESNSEVVKYMRPGIPSTIPSGSIVIHTNLYIPSGATVNLSNVKVQLELGEEITTWEPYTGGKALPSPDYPQEIKAVTGKNLLDCRGLVERTDNGITYIPVYDVCGNLLYVEANGIASANSSYALHEAYIFTVESIFSGCPKGGNSDTGYFTVVGGVTYEYGEGLKVQPSNIARWIGIGIRSGYTADHLRFYPMIRPASITDSTYVPYGCLRVKTSGKNLFDLSKALYGFVSSNGVITASTTNLVSDYIDVNGMDFSISTNSAIKNIGVATFDANKNMTSRMNYANSDSVYVEANENSKYIRVWFAIDDTAIDNRISSYEPIITVGEVTSYEPYQESSITLSTPITLNGHNGVQDRIVRKDGVWGVDRYIKRRRLQSGDVWEQHSNGWIFTSTITDFAVDFNSGTVHFTYGNCTHFVYHYDRVDVINKVSEGITMWYESSYNGYRVAVYSPLFATVEEWNTFLSENEVYIHYPLAEPIFEPLPTADQIALNSLASFDGVTYLYFDSEIEPTSLVEYGTSKVGGYTLDAWNKAENNRIRIEEVTTAMLALNQE